MKRNAEKIRTQLIIFIGIMEVEYAKCSSDIDMQEIMKGGIDVKEITMKMKEDMRDVRTFKLLNLLY